MTVNNAVHGGPAGDEAAAGRGGARRIVRAVLRDRWAVAGAVTIVGFVLAALLAPALSAITGQDPYTYHLDLLDDSGVPRGFGGGISAAHWFGVEPLTGRDLFAVVVHGARTSLLVGLGATAVSACVGVLVGLVSGFLGGWPDRVAGRAVDVILGFPLLVFIIALTTIVPAGFPRPLFLILIMGAFGWPGIARVVRGQTLAVRERAFVAAATVMGAPRRHVIRSHVLPNIAATVIVVTTIVVPGMIGIEAVLSFLGVGVAPPTPSWGRTIGDAVGWMQTSPMYLVFPGLALFLVTFAFNAFGDGLRDALDPRGGRA
ncbi:ABC transporter permease [Dactylosporangium sp. CA-092794]|uniref:ABC transporter permease n=1 Tax=Dactylosporangium sp. CA-092794 TaxID=3239929 RepID=UPI003D8D55A8